jgi:hypothetical protein
MTAFAPISSGNAAIDIPPVGRGEMKLVAAVLRIGRHGGASRLSLAFGDAPAAAIMAAWSRLAAASGEAVTDADVLACLIAASINGPDAEERARPIALRLVPAHAMQDLVLAARDFGLAVRRAVLQVQGTAPPPCGPSSLVE